MSNGLLDGFPRMPKAVHAGPWRTYGFRPRCGHATFPVSVSADVDGLWIWSAVACHDPDCDLVFRIRERVGYHSLDSWVIQPPSEADENAPSVD